MSKKQIQDESMRQMPTLTDAELMDYRGTKWKIERDHGEFGIRRIYEYFLGNATAVSEFLGFSHNSAASRKFTQYDLHAIGKESPRFPSEESRPPEKIHEHLLSECFESKYAERVRWELPKGVNVGRLQTIADVHLQSRQCAYNKLVEAVNWIKERNWVKWIGCGDMFDLVTKTSVGSMTEQTMSLTEALELASWLFKPIAHQCIGLGCGNHDLRLLFKEDITWNPVLQLCRNLDILYLGYHSAFMIDIGRDDEWQTYTCYYHHGKGAAQTKGGKLNSLIQIMSMHTAELTIAAHNHYELASKEVKMHVNPDGSISSITRRGVSCPSFLNWGGYAEDKGLMPEGTGTIGIEFSSDKHKIRVIE